MNWPRRRRAWIIEGTIYPSVRLLQEPGKRGFGSRLITVGVNPELGGLARLEFGADGLRRRLDVPV